ncbi:hypothetical protein GALMADRAFT_224268 [Galerina marginata CBS 339.88]|uniref:Uncharacterized protein n=1 Tax=Galerina marginata (strain CBS 339.88) TaxID=685588 RepID=A0A067T7C6_GALM3|nr:hypothetical protein GALMADRAFT_224268 [Galerina marginata CBS 339.88]
MAQSLGAQPEPKGWLNRDEQGASESTLFGVPFETSLCTTSCPERQSDNLEISLTTVSNPSNVDPRAKALPSSKRSSLTSNSDNPLALIATLKQKLSPHTSDEILSIADIISLYKKASQQSLLHHIGGEQFTTLLSLCGNLSLPLTEGKLAYGSLLAPRFQLQFAKSKLWSFVLKIGEDMERLGFELSTEDRYWVIQACLAQAKGTIGENSHPALARARSQYQHVKNMTNDPDLHLPYLKALILSGNLALVQEGIQHLCAVLDRVPDPHPRFPELLWETILWHASDLPTDSKEKLSQTSFNRMSVYPRPSSFGVIAASTLTPGFDFQGVLRVQHLSASFATTLFPCYCLFHPESLSHWAIQQARQALAPNLPLDIRWNNLILLANSRSPESFPVKYQLSSTAAPDSGNSLWRATLILESMSKQLSHASPNFGNLCQAVQNIARPLWKMFLTAKHDDQPTDVNRAYVSAFLRIAAKSFDEQLKGACFLFVQSTGLWHHSWNNAQVVDNITAYIIASVAIDGRDWPRIYSSILDLVPDINWQAGVTDLLLWHYSSENIDIAYDLYVHGLGAGIDVSPRALRRLFTGLVANHRWTIVASLFDHPTTSRNQAELLFRESLRLFQVQRYQYADVGFVKVLSRVACKLYEQEPPPPSLKYPIRYFLSIMIWTQNTSKLVKLVKDIHQTSPELFTIRLVHRLVRQLIRRRELSNAFRLFRIFYGTGGTSVSRSLDGIRRLLMHKFSKVGAFKLARRLSRSNKQVAMLSKRNRGALTCAVGRRMLPSPLLYLQRIRVVLTNTNDDGPTIREAVSSLIRAKRFYAARKLYAKYHSFLDQNTSTAIGNIILHGPMHDHEFRHGRLVRHILRTKDVLSSDYGFVPDRATVNIVLKAFLRWKTMLDTSKVRHLFDKMVHGGYPVPEQFRRKHGVPFNSPPGSLEGLSLPPSSVHISFSKHIRPLYKMFIKALYIRNDVSGAKTVVGILKEVEIQEMREREKRSRARREGIIKKRMRESKKRAEACS